MSSQRWQLTGPIQGGTIHGTQQSWQNAKTKPGNGGSIMPEEIHFSCATSSVHSFASFGETL